MQHNDHSESLTITAMLMSEYEVSNWCSPIQK